ncbi:MAG: hypothetical protein ACKO3W_09095 [bacterium]
MSIRATLLLLTLLVVLLPLGVAAASWWGLERLDREIEHISEEYEEARTLAGVETELRIGIALLGSASLPTADGPRQHFAAAEVASLLLGGTGDLDLKQRAPVW